MSNYAHKKYLLDTPQIKTKTLTATGDANRIYSPVITRKAFRTAMVFIQLPDGVAAAGANKPAIVEVYGVEDSGDAANTRTKVAEKELTGLTDWSGVMALEICETHFGMALGTDSDGGPDSLHHLQVAVAGPNAVEYEVIVVLQHPYTQKDELILESNTF